MKVNVSRHTSNIVRNHLGIDDPLAAAQYLASARIPCSFYTSGTSISHVQLQHIYVEAFIPYVNCRGTIEDDKGKAWVGEPETGKLARQQLTQLGAKFDYFEPAGAYDYLDTWRQQAYKLRAGGPAGELAQRMELEDAFKQGYCAGKATFSKVIQRGESYLRQKHDSKDLTAVRLMVADAYRDMVTLAEGADDNVNQKEYSNLKATARKKAIMHYRKALADSRLTRKTMLAWDEAWRLIAGVPPHSNYCWGD